MVNIIHSIRDGLAKTRKNLSDRIGSLVLGEKIDESFLEELEEALIASDVGMKTASLVLADLNERFKRNELSSPVQVRARPKQGLFKILPARPAPLSLPRAPTVIPVVGANVYLGIDAILPSAMPVRATCGSTAGAKAR